MGAEVFDTVTPALSLLAKTHPREAKSSLRSGAYKLNKILKAEMREESPGGQRWPGRSTRDGKILKKRRNGSLFAGRSGNTSALGRLRAASRYKVRNGGRKVVIGFLSRSAERLAALHAAGGSTTVTPKMRRMFAAAGRPLRRSTRTIALPRRRAVEPVYTQRRESVRRYIECKTLANIAASGLKISGRYVKGCEL